MATAVIKSDGDRIDYTPLTDVVAGQIILLNGKLFLASEAIASGVKGALAAAYVALFPKSASEAVAVGDTIYWDDVAAQICTDADDGGSPAVAHTNLGRSLFAAAQTATTILFRQV
jgi:predicted RecA/RadA family phage recombinase